MFSPDRRLGRFDISVELIGEVPEAVRRVMRDVIVVRAECHFAKKAIEYVALCEDFEEVPEGQEPPEYDVEYDQVADVVAWSLRD